MSDEHTPDTPELADFEVTVVVKINAAADKTEVELEDMAADYVAACRDNGRKYDDVNMTVKRVDADGNRHDVPRGV